MCLLVKTKKVYTVKNKPKVFYKVLMDLNSRLYTPYQLQEVNLDTVNCATKNIGGSKITKFKFSKSNWVDRPYLIERGLHGFKTLKAAKVYKKQIMKAEGMEHEGSTIVKMILPQGTKYCTGICVLFMKAFSSVVSTKAIYKELK